MPQTSPALDAAAAGRPVGFDLATRQASLLPEAALPAGAPASSSSAASTPRVDPVVAPDGARPAASPTGEARDDASGFVFSPDDRVKLGAGNMTVNPWRTIGRMWMKWPDGTESSASGSMIGPRDFITAGHCVYSADHGGWASQIYFSAGQDGYAIDDPYNGDTDFKRSDNQYYGEAYATYLRSYQGWTSSGNWDYDFAVVTLDRNLGDYTGWMGYGYNDDNGFFNNRLMNTSGYPGDLTPSEYDQWRTADRLTAVNSLNVQSNLIDIYPGQSGSPLYDYDGTNRYTYGVVSSEWSSSGGAHLYNQFTRINGQRYNDINTYKSADGRATDRPDLTSYDEWYDTSYDSHASSGTAGGSASLTAYVRNNGTAAAGAFTVSFYASTNDIISSGDTLLGSATVSSLGAFNWTSVSLSGTVPSGLAAGTYYVGYLIDSGGSQSEFAEYNNTRLMPGTLSVTGGGGSPDRFEPDDSLAAAWNFGTVSGTRTEADLSIHAAGNGDFYRVVAGADGTLNVSLAFTHAAGDIDMQLLDATGTYLVGSGSTGNSESVTYAATRGTAYVVYVYGYNSATNPSYTMTITGPAVAPDRFEPNDAFGSARDLGSLAAGTRTEDNLTIHASGNGDYYAFRPAVAGHVTTSIAFRHDDGDTDMEVLDSAGNVIGGSYGVSDGESFDFDAVAGVTYVLRVYGYAGSTNWNYGMSFVLAPVPAVASRTYNYLAPPPGIAYTFSTNVAASLDVGDLTLTNRTTGVVVPAASMAVNAATGTFTFPGYARGTLPDGNYRAVLHAAGVTDGGGVPLAGDDTFDFFVLAGDANRDRVVNFTDLLAVAQNYGQSGRDYAHGNFDYSTDGTVAFTDLLIIAQRYGASLPALTGDDLLVAAVPADKRGRGVAADLLA